MVRNPLHAICPYFAMFPESFVEKYVNIYSKRGDLILDPFCGRGTTVLQAGLMGRKTLACDINPVAYCVSAAKAEIPMLEQVINRIEKLHELFIQWSDNSYSKKINDLPEFFTWAFHKDTLPELLYLREALLWKRNEIDRFIMALLLGSLHGDLDKNKNYFSNQMPRTISTKPAYSIRYWKRNNLFPESRDVFEILKKKAHLRLKETEFSTFGKVICCDARNARNSFNDYNNNVSLVITSPPYLNVTSFEEDQWLRLWMVGGNEHPKKGVYSKDDKYTNKVLYWKFLHECWEGIKSLLKEDCIFVIRLGARGMDESELTIGLESSLIKSFTNVDFLAAPRISAIKGRQTNHFIPKSIGCRYEMDFEIQIKK